MMKRLSAILLLFLSLIALSAPVYASSTPNKGYDLQTTGTNRGLWGVIVNNIFTKIDRNIAARLEVDVTGSTDVTITATQAEYLYHELSGILTGSIDYIVPDAGSFFIIENITTGSFTITIATSNGGTGVVVPQSGRSLVYVNADDNKVVEVIPLGTTLNNMTTDRILGRDTAGTGAVEQLTVTGGLEFTSSGGIQRSALTGDVAATAGSNTTTIQPDAVTTAKILDDAVTLAKLDGDIAFASKLIGYDGAGDPANISTGSGIQFSSSTISAAAGSVLQVVQVTKTDTFTSSGNSWQDITGMSASITPSSASNKVLVFVQMQGDSNTNNCFLKLVRGSSDVYLGDTASNRTRASAQISTLGSSGSFQSAATIMYLDSPATTSSTTYKVQGIVPSAGTFYINRSQTNTDISTFSVTASSITLVEIKG